jgi:hypothetical protein
MRKALSQTTPSFWPCVLPPLAAFVAAGLLAPMYSSEPFDAGLTAWQAVVLWPIGLALLAPPVSVLLGARTTQMVRLGQLAIGLVCVASMVAVAISDDAQAGLAFLWTPIVGSMLAAALVVVDRSLRRRREPGID